MAIILVLFSTVSGQKKTVKKPAAKPAPKTKPLLTPAPEDIAAKVSFPAIGAPDADGWRSYQSSEDSFRISFPPTPVAVEESDEEGKKTGNRYYNPTAITLARLSLTVIVSDLGAPADDPAFQRLLYKTWLQGVMENRPGTQAAALALEKEFTLGSKSGLEVVVDKGAFRFHAKVISVKNKLYQIAVGSATPDAVNPEENAAIEKWTKKFFDSFYLLP